MLPARGGDSVDMVKSDADPVSSICSSALHLKHLPVLSLSSVTPRKPSGYSPL